MGDCKLFAFASLVPAPDAQRYCDAARNELINDPRWCVNACFWGVHRKTADWGNCKRFAKLRFMTLDELTAQLKAVLSGNPGEDLQKNLRATLTAGLSRMDVVSKQEFDVQREMLNVLRAQIDELTAKVGALERQQGAK